MENNQTELQKILDKSRQILVILPNHPTDELISSGIALSMLLEKMQKNSSLLLENEIPPRLLFLKQPKNIINNLSGSRDFVIVFNTEKNNILDVKCDQKEKQYEIRITPQQGAINPKDFSFMPADFKYDLLIILGAENIEDLGEVYAKNTDLFFEVPKVNIDNHGGSSEFGQLNMIDPTACGAAEILARIALENFESFMDKEISQAMLTGIISATESFQRPNTTPKSMVIAAKLMKYKADQPTIIRHLYKTKSMPFLKLWGRVMVRLNWNEEKKLCWSIISAEDFVQSHSSSKDIPYVLEQIQENFSQGRIFAVIYSENPQQTSLSMRFSNSKIARDLSALFERESQNTSLAVDFKQKDLIQVEKILLEKIGAD